MPLHCYIGEKNKIVVFCSILNGAEPKIGEVFHIESTKGINYVYEITLYNVKENQNLDGSKFLELYFEGVDEKDVKFTPQIRRLK